MATGDLQTIFRADQSSSSRDMLTNRQTERRTDTDRRVDHNTLHPYRGAVTNGWWQLRRSIVLAGSVCFKSVCIYIYIYIYTHT